jgi:hypothetical protein
VEYNGAMCMRNLLTGLLLFLVSVLPATAQVTTPATGNFDGPAELPRVRVKSSLADTPAPGKVRKVHAGDDLEQVLNQAACGDTIQLEAGAVFTGRFVIPDKKCDDAHWIILRTSAPDSALPPEGSRLTPCYAGVASLPGRPVYPCSAPKNVLARLELPHEGSGPLVFAPGANHYRFTGLEITRTAPGKFIADLVYVEAKSTADHLIFDRDWIHGTPQDDTTRGIGLGGSTNVAVVDSYFSDFHCVAITGSCTDAEAIAGGTGPYPMGPYKIENNFLEASGEVIILGGGSATTTPTDIEIRRNHLFRPLTWNKASPGFVGGADGHPFIVKNIFELKNAQRVLFENNVLENCWGGFSQAGFAILLTPKSQGKNMCPDCLVLDVTIRYSRIRNVGAGFQLANAKSDFGAFPKDGGRYSIHDVLLENVDGKQFQGAGTLFQLSSFTVPLHDISISHITGETSKSLFVVGASAEPPKIARFAFTNNLIGAGQQPMETTGGGPKNCAFHPEAQQAAGVFESCFDNPKVAGNVIIGGFGKWPSKNSLAKNHAEVRFMAADKDRVSDYRLHPDSRYKKAGTDQKDVGADVDAIENATQGAE